MFDFFFHNRELMIEILDIFKIVVLPMLIFISFLCFSLYCYAAYTRYSKNKNRQRLFFENKNLKPPSKDYKDLVLLTIIPVMYFKVNDDLKTILAMLIVPYSMIVFMMVFVYEAVATFALFTRNEFKKP